MRWRRDLAAQVEQAEGERDEAIRRRDLLLEAAWEALGTLAAIDATSSYGDARQAIDEACDSLRAGLSE